MNTLQVQYLNGITEVRRARRAAAGHAAACAIRMPCIPLRHPSMASRARAADDWCDDDWSGEAAAGEAGRHDAGAAELAREGELRGYRSSWLLMSSSVA